MIVVADTTPLNYLVLIGEIEILPKLFDEVFAPPEVIEELQHPRTPQPPRKWAAAVPQWLKVVPPSTRLASTTHLGAGEASAISLAQELKAPAVLMDDQAGRKVALAEGLIVVRTLALLELAAERDMLQLPATLAKLKGTTFRLTPELVRDALARDSARSGRIQPPSPPPPTT